jgi:MoaA/NifB/PqqE/SkfB family radical SAM enzyme
MEGIRNCQEAGIKVGLRFTINKFNVGDIPAIFDLLEDGHPAGLLLPPGLRGPGHQNGGRRLDPGRTRAAVDLIIDRTRALHAKGIAKEVLTVDNHADGPYLYLRLLKKTRSGPKRCLSCCKMNEGNNSGRGIGCVSWDGECLCRPVLAPPQLRERPPAPVFRNLDPAGRRPAA